MQPPTLTATNWSTPHASGAIGSGPHVGALAGVNAQAAHDGETALLRSSIDAEVVQRLESVMRSASEHAPLSGGAGGANLGSVEGSTVAAGQPTALLGGPASHALASPPGVGEGGRFDEDGDVAVPLSVASFPCVAPTPDPASGEPERSEKPRTFAQPTAKSAAVTNVARHFLQLPSSIEHRRTEAPYHEVGRSRGTYRFE
jgi:hypothetical protein